MLAPWVATLPFTYHIGYESNHIGNEDYLQNIRDGQPRILHVGNDVPLLSWLGNVLCPSGDISKVPMNRTEPEDIPPLIEKIRKFVDDAHAAGAREIVPYLCTMIMVGNEETRSGFWEFYDRWEDFEFLGIGPKPETDPIDWIGFGPKQLEHSDLRYHEPTIAQPDWRRYLRACTDLVAQCGYDGTFLDVNGMVGFTKYDRDLFREYLAARYTESQLLQLFGYADKDEIEMGRPWAEGEGGLLWVETQRFRSDAFGECFADIRKAGEKRKEGFFLVVNNTPMTSMPAFTERCHIGNNLGYVGSQVRAVMFEEMKQPGRFGMDRINDRVIQYKYALAYGARGVVLPYHATEPHTIDICNAEAVAGGGGAFVQPGFPSADRMGVWGEWIDAHRDSLEGLNSVHDIGVAFFPEQVWWNNLDHLKDVYRLRLALSEAHVLFDFLVEPNFTIEALRTCRAVVIPGIMYMSNDQIEALREYVSGGGHVLIVGECGTHDELGIARESSLVDMLGNHGSTTTVCHLDELVPRRDVELFELDEEKSNDTDYCVALPDRVPSQEEAQIERDIPLVPLLEELADQPLPMMVEAPYALRVSAYQHPDSRRLVVHIINYDSVVEKSSRSAEPVPVQNVRLRTPALKATLWTPDGDEGIELSADADGVMIPEIGTYAMVEIEMFD
jgi:hypothetical protein